MVSPGPRGRRVVIAQCGGPTAVVNASLVGAFMAARAQSEPVGVLGARFGFEGILQADYVDLSILSDEDLRALERTPGAALGSSRYRPTDAQIEQAVIDLVGREVASVVAIGGNDSADTLHRIHQAAQRFGRPVGVYGVPKTIDNDLVRMDHSPGYGSAARYIALAVREAGVDTSAMRRTDPIKIVEVMGRNAGWLAAASALAREAPDDPPHLIFLPERPRPLAQMIDEVGAAYRRRGWVVVVLSENQRDDADQPLAGGGPIHVDPHGHSYHESSGAHLARQVQSQLGLRTRYERPGSLQRTSVAALSETDLREAGEVGREAMRRALAGETDAMVGIQRVAATATYAVALNAVPLGEIAGRERRLPDEFIAATGTGVTEAFLDYARPLIGAPLPSLAPRLLPR